MLLSLSIFWAQSRLCLRARTRVCACVAKQPKSSFPPCTPYSSQHFMWHSCQFATSPRQWCAGADCASESRASRSRQPAASAGFQVRVCKAWSRAYKWVQGQRKAGRSHQLRLQPGWTNLEHGFRCLGFCDGLVVVNCGWCHQELRKAKSLGGKPWAGWRQCRIPIASSRPGIFPFAFKAQLRLLSLWSHHKKPTDNTTKIIIPWKAMDGSTAHAASVRLPAYTRKRVLQPGFWIWCLWSRI